MDSDCEQAEKLYQCVMALYMEQLMPIKEMAFLFGIFTERKDNPWMKYADGNGGVNAWIPVKLYILLLFLEGAAGCIEKRVAE